MKTNTTTNDNLIDEIRSYAEYIFAGANEPPFADVENGPDGSDAEWQETTFREAWRAASSTIRGMKNGTEIIGWNHAMKAMR